MAAKKNAVVVPPESALQAALSALIAKVEADVAALVAKLPAEAKPAAEQIEQIVKMALDDFNWVGLRAVIAAELVSLLTTGKSAAPHDPTELA